MNYPKFISDRRLQRNRTRNIAISCGVAVAAAALVAIAVTELKEPGPTPVGAKLPKAALTISVAQAAIAEFQEQVSASGPIVAWQEAIIGAPLAGLRLVELNVDVGATVRRGQVLAQYDTASLRASEAQAVATVAQVRAASEQASLNNERAIKLRGSGALSDQDLLQFSTLNDSATAQLAAAQAALRAIQVQLRDATIVAPDDGIISARSATLGAIGGVGQELFRIIRRGRVEWRAQLTPAQAARVAAGQPATVAPADNATSAGKVRLLAPSMDPQSRLLTAYVDLKGGPTVRAGMYASGEIDVGSHKRVCVPATSLVAHDGNTYVFVVKRAGESSTVMRRAVARGRSQESLVEILGGLRAGESVASSGAGFLEDGDIVRIASAVQKMPEH